MNVSGNRHCASLPSIRSAASRQANGDYHKQIAIISEIGRQIEKMRLVLEGSAGEAVCWGGERGGGMLPEFEDFVGEHSVKDLARRSEGGGGFKGYRLPPTPMRTRVGGFCIVFVSIASIVR